MSCSLLRRPSCLRLIAFALLSIACTATAAGAQTTTPPVRSTARIAWDQAEGAVAIQSFDIVIDGVPSRLSTFSCARGPSASACSANLPLLSPGEHTVSLVAIDAAGGRSAPSSPLSVSATTAVEIRAALTPVQREDTRSGVNA